MRPARYMGGGGGFIPPVDPSSWAFRLTVASAALWILAMVAGQAGAEFSNIIFRTFVFSADSVLRGEVWQLVTYTLFEAPRGASGVLWSLFAFLVLWSFGTTIERQVGSRAFLYYVFGFALAGSVLTCLTSLVWHTAGEVQHDGLGVVLTALTVVYARLNPDTPIYFNFLLPISGRTLVLLTLVILGLQSLASSPAIFLPHFGAFAAAEVVMNGLSPRRLYLQFRAWQIERSLRKKASRFTVIPGEKDSKPPGGGSNGYLH